MGGTLDSNSRNQFSRSLVIAMKKLLVISDYGPSDLFAGGLVLNNQLAVLENSFFIDYLLFSPHPESYSFKVARPARIYSISKPGERMPLIRSKLLKELFGSVYERGLLHPYIKKQASFLSKILSEENYDSVFITLEGSQVPQIVSLAKFQNSKIFLQYWDSEEWWAEVHNFSHYNYQRMMKAYDRIESMEKIERVIVPSIGMRNVLEERSPKMHAKIEVLYPPSSSEEFSEEISEPLEAFLSRNDVNIVFSGSLYASAEIKQFIRALEGVNWNISGKSIGLVMFCAVSVYDYMPVSSNIYYGGRVPPQFVNQVAGRADLLFLPYPLTNSAISKSSFPSKLGMYCFHKKNIFVIAPGESSLAAFLVQNRLDQFLVTDDLERSVIGQLTKFIEEDSVRNEQIVAVSHTYSKYFSKQIFLGRVFQIFGVEPFRANLDHEFAQFVPSGNFVVKLNFLGRRLLSVLRYLKRTFLGKRLL